MQGIITGIKLLIWMLIIPYCCGMPLARHREKEENRIAMTFLMGYLFVISMFQVIYVGFVIFYNHFTPLVWVTAIFYLCFAAISILLFGKEHRGYWKKGRQQKKKTEWFLWIIFLFLLGFQLYKTVVFAYPDGDDAFYTVLSVITGTSDTMYLHVPYTGETSILDQRHAFSSAPVFMAFLGRVSGVHPVIMTNVAYSILVIVLVYLTYKLIANVLLEEDKEWTPLFLIVISLLYLYGNSTIYQDTTFLMTRTGQGKAFLANVIPETILLALLLLNQKMKRSKEGEKEPWILLAMSMLAAGYTSTMGMFLAPFLSGIGIVILAIRFRRPVLLFRFMLAFAPLGILAGTYLIKVFL